MIMNKLMSKRKRAGRIPLLAVLGLVVSVFFWMVQSEVSFAATAKVQASSGWVREKADTNSNALGSVERGTSLEILEETKDSQGYTWYKVPVEGNLKGYIRADLVSVTGSIPAADDTSAGQQTSNDNSSSQSEEAALDATVSETEVTGVKTISQSRIRKGPGTTYDSAGGINAGMELVVTGVATGSDGQNWYKVNLADNSISGFIREDLVEITQTSDPAEMQPEETSPETEVSETVNTVEENNDFHLKYMANENGDVDWYLFNNIEGTSMSLTQMLDVIEQVRNKQLDDEKTASFMKNVVLVMGVVMAVLIIIITILALKLKSAYSYVEYEEEEEEEAAEEIETVEESAVVEEEVTVKQPRSNFGKKSRKPTRESLLATDEEDEIEVAQSKDNGENVKPDNKAWQSKDFLELDDDMEFEFLDL